MLTLGLAACNTTGGTTTTTPPTAPTAPTTELGKAQAAAKAAMDAAKTQSDAAAVEAAKAEAAEMNLAMLQTGDPMAKKHAEAARAAARAAMTAYNTAKAESAKAAAATTSTAAVMARIAAQAAQRTAQAQAKIAMDKAAEAVKAAGMEVKVTYDDDGQATYRVGEVMIVPGAENSTVTTNGKTVTTGKIRDIFSIGRGARDKVAYKAASGDDAEVMAQPAVGAQAPVVGSVTDSADDSMRLYLVDKYQTSKSERMVSVYRNNDEPGSDKDPGFTWGYDGTITERTPYGTIGVGGNTYVIKRAEGLYYEVTGPNTTPNRVVNSDGRVDNFTVAAGQKPDNTKVENGIFYYDNVDGERTWMKRVGVFTDGRQTVRNPQANTGILYHYIKTPVHNVRFPVALPFEHLNYGTWAGLKEDGNTLADLGTGFVSKLPDGTVTPTGDMPNFGTATYEGGWTGNLRAAAADGDGAIRLGARNMTTEADFGENTLTTTLDGLATLKGGIDGNGFSGTDVTVNASTTYGLDNDGTFTGKFSGSFFGPKAEEIGGVFDITSEGAKAGEARGAFGGGMTASE